MQIRCLSDHAHSADVTTMRKLPQQLSQFLLIVQLLFSGEVPSGPPQAPA